MNKDLSVSSGGTTNSSTQKPEDFYDMDQVNQENQADEGNQVEEGNQVDEGNKVNDKEINVDHDNDHGDDDHDDDDDYIHLIPSPTVDEISKVREILFLLTLAYTQLITQAVLSQSIVPSNVIARDLNVLGQPGEISWFSASFSLTVGTFILIGGRLGDVLGYKKVYLCSYAWLSIWSMITGLTVYTGSNIFYDVSRSMQGLALSISMPNALGIIGHYYPIGGRKNMAMGLFAAVAPGGFVIGAIFSAIFGQFATWPWMYYTTAIASVFVLLISYLIIPKNIGSRPKVINYKSFDILGSITGVSALILFNFSWNQGPVVGWDTPYVYVLLIVSILMLIAFYFIERRVENPLIPNGLSKDTWITLVIIAAGWSSFGIWLFYGFLYGYEILGLNMIVSAIQFIPTLFAGLIAGLTTGAIIHKVPVQAVLLVSMVAFLVGSILNGLRPKHSIYWAMKFPSMCITSFGMDTSFPAGIVMLSDMLPKRSQGLAASLMSTCVNYSISIGLGFAGTVEYYIVRRTNHPDKTWMGIRSAQYTGIGLAGLGLVICLLYIIQHVVYRKKDVPKESNKLNESGEDESNV
ncbi:unnamed protein product [[Candida] boidinii]|uniref:Unnamed protein product n=1 Tax=Candida boidinii TaxID=5477 RepID=A0A9W6SY01_CANBO|nr:hypothetical protein B5S30_g3026 [[Candida] boidinii]OWB85566.1 hypothetical protein B5S33_g4235 [[Candida] boidinii]GME69732.1 unnamed protein product [[Candida] boidinii]GMF99672.1 unnamed protein product [[Candida] boidinii]